MYLSFRRLYRSKCHIILDFDVIFYLRHTRNNFVKESQDGGLSRCGSRCSFPPQVNMNTEVTIKISTLSDSVRQNSSSKKPGRFLRHSIYSLSRLRTMCQVMVKLLYHQRWPSVPVFRGPPSPTPRYPQPCRPACTSGENQPQSLAR